MTVKIYRLIFKNRSWDNVQKDFLRLDLLISYVANENINEFRMISKEFQSEKIIF